MAKNFMNKVNIDEQDYLSKEQKKKAKEEERKAEAKAKAFANAENAVDSSASAAAKKAAEKIAAKKYVDEKRNEKRAAEESAALDKLDVREFLDKEMDPVKSILEYEPKLFGEEDRTESEYSYPGFGKSFLDILVEERKAEQARVYKEADLPGYRPKEEPEYLSYADRAKQSVSNAVLNTYNTGEKWLMSEEEDDLAKGFINNFRSAIGSGVEDFAYLINDIAPWYKPAQTVVENNMAGGIAQQAQKQFENAKESGVNGKFVDFLDATSKGLGYSLFGLKTADYAQTLGEGFEEYRKLREQGYSKEEATKKSLAKTGFSFAEDKFLGDGGNWLNKKTTRGNIYGFTANSDEFVDNFNWENYNGANKQGELVNEFYDLLTDQEWAQYYQKIAERGKLNSPIGDIYVWDGNGIIVISKRVRVTGNTNDYQVIDFDFTKNSYEAAQEIQKEIDKNGGRYNARKIAEIIDSFGQ